MEPTKQTPTHADADRVLVPVGGVARMLSVSIRAVWKLTAAGKLPKPLRLGRSVRWNVAELAEWISRGCPDVGDGPAMRKAGADR